MRKIILACLLFTTVYGFSQNTTPQIQQDNDPTFWDNVRFGGGLGFAFGNRNTTINVSPSAIYDFQNGFAAGVGVGYLYSKVNNLTANVISPSIIMFYNPAKQIQLSAEYEHLFVNRKSGYYKEQPFDYSALYFGLAYRTGWAAFGVRYDALYNPNKTIYSSAFSPIIRFYF